MTDDPIREGDITDHGTCINWRTLEPGDSFVMVCRGRFRNANQDYTFVNLYGGATYTEFSLGEADAAEWYRVTLALPTEPGVRFWGKPLDHPAEWWFVQEFNGPRYISSGGYHWEHERAVRQGLVRLPDPEPQP
jgi:hypothetical protein